MEPATPDARGARPLPEREIHLTLADPVAVAARPELVERYLRLLVPEERARHDRLLSPVHRNEYLVTRALIRSQLSRYSDVQPQDWRFVANQHGRPELDGHEELAWLRFNLSNTRGLIACAIARGCDVGVDVEDLSRRQETVAIADRFFSPAEAKSLRALPPERQRDRFFDFWTLKESYIKARGLGLAIPLDQFTFRIEPGCPIRIETDPSLGDDATSWQFWLTSPGPLHRLAVAVRRGDRPEFSLRTEWVTPLEE